MSLFSPFGLSLSTVRVMAQASQAAFGGAAPTGWSVSRTFDDAKSGASATVFQRGNSYIVSFRGTDDSSDIVNYPRLLFGNYIDLFDSLLESLPAGANYYVTGASLGGGAVNNLADIADTAYGGKFANATFVAFASPNISGANGIVNVGFENDRVYKALGAYQDHASSLDNLVLATKEYMAGNVNGLLPPSDYAHASSLGWEAFGRLSQSAYSSKMQPDSIVIFDAASGKVQDITPGRSGTGAFYLGSGSGDHIAGRNGNDYLEGFLGADWLRGGAGADWLRGGAGNDVLNGGSGGDHYVFDSRPGSTNVDTITGYNPVEDTIDINNAVFTKVGANGRLARGAFWTGPEAHDFNDRIIYDAGTGGLFYDPDGNGPAVQVRFAQLAAGLGLSAADILVI
jgi:Ca2+-binding RTX toxin-like protein